MGHGERGVTTVARLDHPQAAAQPRVDARGDPPPDRVRPRSLGGLKRIEEADPDRTFTVGLLYGPSGCGKSSLVKAGLLPRLAGHVVAIVP